MIKPLRLLKPALKVSCDPVCPWSPCTGLIFFALITWNMTCVPGLLPLLSTQEKKRPVFLNPPLLELRQLVKDQQCFLNQLHLGGHFFPLHLVELAQQPQVE